MEILGNVIIASGAVFTIFGIVGLFRFDNFYTRLMTSSKGDTVGSFTIMVGIVVRNGINAFTLKLLLLIVIVLLLNPLTTYIMAESAYLCGYKIGNDDVEKVEEVGEATEIGAVKITEETGSI